MSDLTPTLGNVTHDDPTFRAPRVPPPQLHVVKNLTPFSHFTCDKMGPGRRFFDTVVVKGAFDLAPGVLARGARAPITISDEYFDPANAASSSLRRAGDALLAKPGTDVIVTGTARAEGGRPSRGWDVAVVVRGAQGTVLRHALQVTGPRRWEHRALRGWTLSDPEPTTEVPIRYELAYGGAYAKRSANDTTEWIAHLANPAGCGFADASQWDRARTYPAPQWQFHAQPVSALQRDVPVAGLGPVARSWSSRIAFAGTYDAEWEGATRRDLAAGLPPDYPADFDLRFFQCAAPALVASKHLRGDEQIGLAGLRATPSPFVIALPGIGLRASLYAEGDVWRETTLPLDTVHIDLDEGTVHLSWRLTLDQTDGVSAVVLDARRGGTHE